jgi:SAM-dependent methyltransferase
VFYAFVSKVARLIPDPIVRKCRLYKLAGLFLSKEEEGLVFWELFAKKFKQDKHRLSEYWEKYRFLTDIQAICKIGADSRVLDVGCGICTVLHCVEGRRFGIDPLADELLKIYAYPEGISVTKGFGENIAFPGGSFDVVFCSNALDHTEDPQKTVTEIHRVLKPHGYFVLTMELLEEKRNRDPAHPHSLAKEDVYALLEGKFETRFEKESPWIGLRAYFDGSTKSHNQELIMVSQKA